MTSSIALSHLRVLDFSRVLAGPWVSQMPGVASPLRLSKTPVRYAQAAPTLGADTERVVAALPTSLETSRA